MTTKQDQSKSNQSPSKNNPGSGRGSNLTQEDRRRGGEHSHSGSRKSENTNKPEDRNK